MWFFNPSEIEFFQAFGAANGFVHRKALIAIGHDFKAVAHGSTNSRQTRIVFRTMRLTDLHLGTGEALGLGLQRILDQRFFLDMQPTTFGRVQRTTILGTACKLPQRQVLFFRTQIPKGRINRSQRQSRNRADGGGVGCKFELAPDRLDAIRILIDNQRHQMIVQQAHDRRAAGADGVAVARTHRTITVGDGDDWRFLADKALDRIGALDLRRKVDHAQFDFFNTRHNYTAKLLPLAASNRCACDRSKCMETASPELR